VDAVRDGSADSTVVAVAGPVVAAAVVSGSKIAADEQEEEAEVDAERL